MEVGLTALFISAFISATLLPGGSEALLAWMVHQGEYSLMSLVLSATAGNVLGSLVTFGMGSLLRVKFPLKTLEKPQHQRAQRLIERYGPLALIMAWLPIIGDPLCFVAGWLGVRFSLSVMTIALGKLLRYLVVAGLFL
ncbi:YqaA family protein [Nitrincola schmidtii]|uniref:YqaA family protein n=1 Tax=Nitrincola schmidtii TaxID=1730894 RepID=UPI00124C9E19|nr:YqaA family protein [Nitrincola schmidtii]